MTNVKLTDKEKKFLYDLVSHSWGDYQYSVWRRQGSMSSGRDISDLVPLGDTIRNLLSKLSTEVKNGAK